MQAHDLHDELTPYLVAVRPHLSILESAARADPALKRFGPTLAIVCGHLDATVARVRHLLESLHPPELQGLTLAIAPQDSAYWTSYLFKTGRIGPAQQPYNQSLNGLMTRVTGAAAEATHAAWVTGAVLAVDGGMG